jgi:Flp pilus assembly protein TadG
VNPPPRMRLVADESASSVLEVALSLTVLLMLMFGIMDCSRALYAYHFTSYAARSATRYASVRGTTWGTTACAATATFQCNATAANVKSYVQSVAPLGISTTTALKVTTTWSGTAPSGSSGTCITTSGKNSPGCLVSVKVTYTFNYVAPFMPKTTLSLTSTSQSIVVQ